MEQSGMKQIEFNVLDEPWIRVMKDDCTVEECSLIQVLTDCHKYRRLAGELPTQDVAILRLLLAVLHTIFSRVDAQGTPNPLDDRSEAVNRWAELWRAGRLPEKPILDYFEKWRDRFWLFHPEYPFWQAPGAKIGTGYSSAKLNGELSESANKSRLFPLRTGSGKERLTYGEAARWLVTLNGFDDTSAKPKEKGLPSPGAGWLGKLGLIYAEGNNLFETLMLNLVLLRNGVTLEDEQRPVWEKDKPKSDERTEIAMPDNQAELLTLQSRRLLLQRDKSGVTGYSLLGGDFFPKENAASEQMTLWKQRDAKTNAISPRRLNPDKQLWRDFSVVTGTGEGTKTPGVVAWIAKLGEKRILNRRHTTCFRTAGVKYGDKDFLVEDVLQDYLYLHTSLLEESGSKWVDLIQRKIEQTEKGANILGDFADGIFIAGGGDAKGSTREAVRKQAVQAYYAAVDLEFRKWLLAIDPERGYDEELCAEKDEQWREVAYKIAMQRARRIVNNAGELAFVGRWIEGRSKGKERFVSSSSEFNRFAARIKKCFDMVSKEKEDTDGRQKEHG